MAGHYRPKAPVTPGLDSPRTDPENLEEPMQAQSPRATDLEDAPRERPQRRPPLRLDGIHSPRAGTSLTCRSEDAEPRRSKDAALKDALWERPQLRPPLRLDGIHSRRAGTS